jgi:hypothetical protein
MKVSILDQNNNLLGTLKLNKGEDTLSNIDSKTGKSNPVFTIVNYGTENEWQSSIIKMGKGFEAIKQKRKTKITGLKLKFEPKGREVDWYIDRLQGVKSLAGIQLTTVSFDEFLKGFGSVFITFAVFFFAFSTLITWSYYGETASAYVFGHKIILPYKLVFVILVFFGSVRELSLVLNFTDLMVGLLVIPNTIAILLLSPKVATWSKAYITALKAGEITKYK